MLRASRTAEGQHVVVRSDQRAITDTNKAISINPKHVNDYNNCGCSKYLQGDFQDANKALALIPNNGATLDTRGLPKHSLGQHRKPFKNLKGASSLG